MKADDANENSNFLRSRSESDCFSVRLLSAIFLQSLQGCLPSKVLTSASLSGASCE